jgi:uncharacterized cupredoxin-like copper-binding protein
MPSRFHHVLLCGAFLALALLTLAACAGSTSSPAMSGMSGGRSAASGASAQVVTVTLSDFKIAASQTTFKTGVPYRFVVTNSTKSTANHEFMIVQPMTDDMSMAEMDKMALHRIDVSQLPPGATKSFDLTFTAPAPAGRLEFACHVGSHYQLGMHTSIIVK